MRDSAVVLLPGATTELHWTDRYSRNSGVGERLNFADTLEGTQGYRHYRWRWNEDSDRIR